jgi:hypothetical protein
MEGPALLCSAHGEPRPEVQVRTLAYAVLQDTARV